MLYSILIYGSESTVAAWEPGVEEDMHPLITDGPFAETKEQLMGIYIVECESVEEATHAAHRLAFEGGVFEIRPVTWYDPGVIAARIPQV
jgi:hypothetical protein